MSSTSSSWISAFQASAPTYDGQIFLFIFLVCGLEKTNGDDTPILFDNIDATIQGSQGRIPIAAGDSFTLERATWQNRGTNRMMLMHDDTVALKFVRRRQSANMNWKHILLEIRALLHSPIRYHPNIVRMIGMSWDLGTLEHLQLNERLPFRVKKKLCWDVSNGLSILHAWGVVHGDLKHENVLIFKNKGDDPDIPYLAKLADFGGSVMDLEKEGTTLHMGTPPYDAPEAWTKLDGEGIKLTDVSSLGLLFWRTLIGGASPFSQTGDSEPRELNQSQVDNLKQSPSLLQLAKKSVRACLDVDASALELADFVLENTIQLAPHARSLVNAIAGLQANSFSEISELKAKAAGANELYEQQYARFKPGEHGLTPDSLGLFAARYAPGGTYDFQEAGPGYRPVLYAPDPGEIIFNPQRLRNTLNRSIQRDIFLDLIAAADARPDQHTTQISRVLACFFLFQCYCHEFGTTFDAEKACRWLKEAALSEDECQENYLAQAWCWRVHTALGVLLDVEDSILRDWIHMAIVRGHRRCIEEARIIAESISDLEERSVWGDDLPMRALDRDIQEEFQLRGISSMDDIYVNERGDGLLHYAAAMGNYTALRHLVITYQPNIDLPGQARQETPLLTACRGGHVIPTLWLIDQGANPDGDKDAEETPFDWLCAFSDQFIPGIADRLIRAGAKGHRRTHRLRSVPARADFEEFFLLPVSPLSRAVMMESLPAVQALLALGADPLDGYDDRSSVCPIVVAAALTLPTILEALLAYLPPVSIFNELEMLEVVLDLKATVHDPMTTQSRLTRCGVEYKSAMTSTLRILHDRRRAFPGSGSPTSAVQAITRLVKLGREDIVRSLLELGHSIRGHPEPIVEAVRLNHESLRGDYHPWFSGEVNLLQIAAEGRHDSRPGLAIAEYLIAHGLPVNPPVEDGSGSAFAFAVLKQDFDLADLLLEHGANTDFHHFTDAKRVFYTYLLNVDDEGNSLAGTSQSRARGDELPSFMVRQDWTALHCISKYIARTDSEKQAIAKMVRLMLSVDVYREYIYYAHPTTGTALLFATLAANLEVVSELLERGADINIGHQGLTPSLAIRTIFQRFPEILGEDVKVVYGEDKVSQQMVWRRYDLTALLLQNIV
ncbi:hypothetical protein PQX77_002321 [Marasmius sp. AFHP31]|nr:hypothetical protein PQX77_002321 [Marasmius sp. AFHP31]